MRKVFPLAVYIVNILSNFLLLYNYFTFLYLLSTAFGCFWFEVAVNNVSAAVLVHVSWYICEILVAVSQKYTYWVLWYTDVQLYTI